MKIAAGISTLLFLAAEGASAAAQPIPLEHFFREPPVVDVQLSPDGQYISALVRTDAYPDAVNIIVMPRAGGSPHPITAYRDIDVAWHIWKGDRIVFQLHRGRDEPKEHAYYAGTYSIRADGKDPRPLHTNVVNRATSLELLDTLPRVPSSMLIAGWKDGQMYPDAYRLDVGTGALEKAAANADEVLIWRADNGGRVRLAQRAINGLQDRLLYRASEGAAWHSVEALDAADIEILGFDADDRQLWVSARNGRDRAALFRIDPEAPAFGNPVAVDERYDVRPRLVRAHDGRPLYARYDADVPRTIWLDPEWREIGPELVAALEGKVLDLESWDDAEKYFIVHARSAQDPGAYYLFDAEQMSLRKLLAVRPWLDPAAMAAVRPVEFTARDGLKIEGYLTIPPASEGAGPLIIHPHGGPFGVRDTWAFNSEVQLLASRGYRVLQVNFRGSGGYGESFEAAGYRQYGRDMQNDLEDAATWAVEIGYADPKRLCIYGGSYGGYAALMALVRTPELFTCGISFAGISDLAKLYQERTGRNPTLKAPPKPPSSAAAALVLTAVEEMLGSPWDDPEYFPASSPALHAERVRAPVMLIHGLSDDVVSIAQHKRMAYALKRARKPFTEVLQGYEGHGFIAARNRQRLYEHILPFLDEHMRSAKELAPVPAR